MKRQQMLKLCGIVWLFCFSLLARGQTPITVTGDDTVCRGNSTAYTTGVTPGLIYNWTVTPEGVVSGSLTNTTTSTAMILWNNVGAATVTVVGIDPMTSTTVEIGTKNVYVVGNPMIYLTSDFEVACDVRPNPGMLKDSLGCIKYCEKSTVTYTANGDPGGTFTWTVTGALSYTPSGNTCTVTWGGVGAGSITVVDISAHGCMATESICIEIIEKPKAGIQLTTGTNFIKICKDGEVNFMDVSTANITSPIVSWYWNFGDGHTSGGAGGYGFVVTHQYTVSGMYDAYLAVKNECGCTDTAWVKVEVADSPGVKITCPSVVCENDKAKYSVDVNCDKYHWNVIGGTIISPMPYGPTIEVLWDNVGPEGYGVVIFTPDASCKLPCSEPSIVKVPVVKQTGTIVGPTIVCPDETYKYVLPQWPTTEYNWYVTSTTGTAYLMQTDQRNEILMNTGPATTAGLITLKANYHNTLLGCGGTATIRIRLLPPATISGDDKVCQGVTKTYTLSSGYVGDWTATDPLGNVFTGSGNTFNVTFSEAGAYIITATSPLGQFCAADPITVTSYPPPPMPDGIVGPDIICRGEPTLYMGVDPFPSTIFGWGATNGAVNAAYGPTSYITFNNSTGPFAVILWREWTFAPYCKSKKLVKVVDTPIIDPIISGLDTVCSSSEHSYTVSYPDATDYQWSIFPAGLGSVAPVNGSQNVSVLWNNAAGAGEVAYLIVDVHKCGGIYKDTLEVYIRGHVPLVLNFYDNSVLTDTICAGYPLELELLPAAGGTITWDFGDGSTATGPSPVFHTYNNSTTGSGPASYLVKVYVTGLYGCTTADSISKVIWVKPTPVALITPVGPFYSCTPPNQTITATVQSGYGATTSYEWFDANGSIMICPSCNSLNVTAYGVYFCVVTNDYGCSDTTNKVKFDTCQGGGGDPGCIPATPPNLTLDVQQNVCGELNCTASATGAYYYIWSFPLSTSVVTGGTLATSTADATYDVAGNYDVSVTVAVPSSVPGDTCFITAHGSGIIPYIVGLNYSIECDNSTPGNYVLTMFDHSNFYPSAPAPGTMDYDFVITGCCGQNNGTNQYTQSLPGNTTYNISLEIGDNPLTHPTCIIHDVISLPLAPTADFSFVSDSLCSMDTSVIFTNLSTPTGLQYLWTFAPGDPTNSSEHPIKVYQAGDQYYDVMLIASDLYGCADTVTKPVYVYEKDLAGELIAPPGAACEGQPVTLTYLNSILPGYPESYLWYKGGSPFNFTTVPTVNVYTPGSYYVEGTNHHFCRVVTAPVVVDFVQVPDAVIEGDSIQCVENEYTLYTYAGTGASYLWLVDGVSSGVTTAEITETYFVPGTHVYQVVITVPNGASTCSDTSAPFTVHVHALPPAPVVTFSALDCPTYLLELLATNSVPGYYNWSDGQTGTPINVNVGGEYTTTFTDTFGCQSKTITMVPKDPATYMWIFPTGCFKFCEELMPKTLVGPIAPFSYWAWMQGGVPDLDGTNSYPADYTITSSGTYNLLLDNGLCADTSGNMELEVDSFCSLCEGPYMTIDSVYKDLTSGCKDYVVVYIQNLWMLTSTWQAVAENGVFIPYSGTIPGMTSQYVTLRYIADPGFTGPTETVKFIFDGNSFGNPCVATYTFDIDPCANSFARYGGDDDGPAPEVKTVIARNDLAEMKVVPNPASNSTRVDYRFSEAGNNRYVELYDLTGRQLSKKAATASNGSVHLELGDYAAGMYLVVIKENGKVLLQSKLTVVK